MEARVILGSILICERCGGGLRPPDAAGYSSCEACGASHLDHRSSEVLATARSGRPSWHDCEEAARIPLTEQAVLDLVRQHFVGIDSVFVHPHIPPKRELAVRRTHVTHLPPRERILALYEATLLDGGHEGFVVTAEQLCWKNPNEPASSIQWRDFDPDHLYLESHHLYIGDDSIRIEDKEVFDASANAFHVLALSGIRPRPMASGPVQIIAPDAGPDIESNAQTIPSPPPPYTTSYVAYASQVQEQEPECTCWQCQTPLYETTPQCAYCGAMPTGTGWRRNG